jgi:isoleucyl-tRNA synthetase
LLAHYEVYEFHPVVAKLQVFCSEDLGAFYLDVLKDRLYTTAPKSQARRSAQTALWHITHAMLRWMAPFMSFTAEEAWALFGHTPSIFTETFWTFDPPDQGLLDKWKRLRMVRDECNKQIEVLRGLGRVGSSLQADVVVSAKPELLSHLASLGDELKFVLITSKAQLLPLKADAPDEFSVWAQASKATKCDRCWHWRDDVGADPSHPAICGRCLSNLYGAGEARRVA